MTDFGLHDLRVSADRDYDLEWGGGTSSQDGAEADSEQEAFKLLWKAPELLRNSSDKNVPLRGTQKGMSVNMFLIIP